MYADPAYNHDEQIEFSDWQIFAITLMKLRLLEWGEKFDDTCKARLWASKVHAQKLMAFALMTSFVSIHDTFDTLKLFLELVPEPWAGLMNSAWCVMAEHQYPMQTPILNFEFAMPSTQGKSFLWIYFG